MHPAVELVGLWLVVVVVVAHKARPAVLVLALATDHVRAAL